MNSKLCAIMAIAILFLSLTVAAADQKYVSFEGEFGFDYPENWHQVDHRIVDAFLVRSDAGESTLEYEAVFGPKGYTPFWHGPYFILSVEAGDAYSDQQIDSVLNKMSRTFGKGVKYFPVANFMTDMESNSPVYDSASKVITVASDIVEKGQLLKKHVLAMKFFEKGLANFYFYTPDSLFDSSSVVLERGLSSFSYGNVDSMLAPESLEVVDAEEIQDNSDGIFGIPVAVFGGLVVVFIVIMTRRKKRRNS